MAMNEQNKKTYKIGTRGSDLALWQAQEVASNLDVDTELVIVKTSGDRFQDIPLQGQSQIGFFTKEIENRLLAKEIDLAVHSLKDLPTEPHENLVCAGYLPRAAVADLLLVHPDWYDEKALLPVKEGCQVGATSLRRQALLRLYAPWTEPAMLRGNVPTRVQKCKDGEYGAIVIARAGLERLGLDTEYLHVYELNPMVWLPAPGQGVVAVQVRRDDAELLKHVEKLDHPDSRRAADLERRLLANFEGGCHTAFGAYAWSSGDKWNVRLGLEEPQKGWGQAEFTQAAVEELSAITAAQVAGFEPLSVSGREDLCREIQL